MYSRFSFVGLLVCLALISAMYAAQAGEGSITLTGPDGTISVGADDINSIIEKKGVPIMLDDQPYQGAALWRVLALCDGKKTLGPGDIVHIAGNTLFDVPYQVIAKNNTYLIVDDVSGPVLVIGSAHPEKAVMQITAIDVSTTDDWTLHIGVLGIERLVTKDEWNKLAAQYRTEKTTKVGTFEGITISDLLLSQEIIPPDDASVKIIGQDGYTAEIPWKMIADSPAYLIADKRDGKELPKYLVDLFAKNVSTPAWPLMHIDPGFPGNESVGNIEFIEVVG